MADEHTVYLGSNFYGQAYIDVKPFSLPNHGAVGDGLIAEVVMVSSNEENDGGQLLRTVGRLTRGQICAIRDACEDILSQDNERLETNAPSLSE